MSNADNMSTGAKIELGGKTRELKCDMWSLCAVEEVTGESVMTGQVFQNITMRKLITLTWAFLLHDPEVKAATEKDGARVAQQLVASWIEVSKMPAVTQAVMEVFTKEIEKGRAAEKGVTSEGNVTASSGTGESV